MSKRFRKLSHTLYECKYHVIFCPKYRYRVLEKEVGGYVKKQIYVLCDRKDKVEVLELTVMPDHVHMVFWLPPKYSVSNFMGQLKGKLATGIFNQFERIGKVYWGRHFWARGYCISTVGVNEKQILEYVKWQEKRDREIENAQRRLFD